jgi:hypothetical protein
VYSYVGRIIAGSIVFPHHSFIHSVGPGQQYAWNDDFWKTVAKAA